MKNNSDLVADWMTKADQAFGSVDTECLYDNLVIEEMEELKHELDTKGLIRGDSVKELKETLYLMWVLEGKLLAMGVNSSEAFEILYYNRLQKLVNTRKNADGKVVQDKELKQRLKDEIYGKLSELFD